MGRKKIESQAKEIMYNDEILTRSNKLITAKHSATLIENKLTAWAMKAATLDEKGRPSVSITTADIRELTGVKGNGIYGVLSSTSKKMTGRTIYFEDTDSAGRKSFKYVNMIHYCEYRDGKFTVTFTPECAEMLYGLKGNFTSLNIRTLFSLSTNASYRLYEILSIRRYLINEENNPIPIVFPLSVLKLELGCIDTEESRVKNELMKTNPDYDKIVDELALAKKYQQWSSFKRYVLDGAVKEINEKTELFVSYEPVRVGRGGKITSVKFFIQRNEGQKETIFGDVIEQETTVDKVMTSEEMERSKLVSVVAEMMNGVSISQKDIISLLKAADNDVEKIQKAYVLAQRQNHISNFVGWMTTAIKEGYEEPVEVVEGSSEKAKVMNDFREDMDAKRNSMAERAWEIMKNRSDFSDFMKFLLETEGIDDVELFEVFHEDCKERTEIFLSWVKDHKKR